MITKSPVKERPEFSEFACRLKQVKQYMKLSSAVIQKGGLTKRILERMLHGQRYPYRPHEKQQLADGLGITFDRITGEDVISDLEEMERLSQHRCDPDSLLKLSNNLESIAVTFEELLLAGFYKTRALRQMFETDEALLTIMQSFSSAELSLAPENKLFSKISTEILQIYFYTEQSHEMVKFIEYLELKKYFQDDDNQKALLLFYHGCCAFRHSEIDKAILFLKESSLLYQKLMNQSGYSRVQASLAHIAYQNKQYQQACDHLTSAIAHSTEEAPYYKCGYSKDYARVLLELGQFDIALKIIDKTLDIIAEESLNFPELKGKLLLMKGHNLRQPQIVSSVLDLQNLSEELIIDAHHVLTLLYNELGEKEKTQFHHNELVAILKSNTRYEHYRWGDWF